MFLVSCYRNLHSLLVSGKSTFPLFRYSLVPNLTNCFVSISSLILVLFSLSPCLTLVIPYFIGQSLSPSHGKYSELLELGKKVAMHVAAAKPSYLDRTQIPMEAIEKEKGILTEQARAQGKTDAIIEKMMVGRMNKYYEDNCLLDQQYILAADDKVKVGQMIEKTSKAIGVPVVVDGFVHFVVGESHRE